MWELKDAPLSEESTPIAHFAHLTDRPACDVTRPIGIPSQQNSLDQITCAVHGLPELTRIAHAL